MAVPHRFQPSACRTNRNRYVLGGRTKYLSEQASSCENKRVLASRIGWLSRQRVTFPDIKYR
jgi:hypothetical protein